MTNAPLPPPLPPPPQPLDYRGDPGSPGFGKSASGARAAPIFSLARLIAALTVMAILLAIFLLIIPRIERVYADFGTKLPWVTQLVLDISRFLQAPLGWVTAAVVTCIVAVAMSALPIPRRWLRLMVTLIMAIIVILLALAVLLPMIDLMDNIAGGKR